MTKTFIDKDCSLFRNLSSIVYSSRPLVLQWSTSGPLGFFVSRVCFGFILIKTVSNKSQINKAYFSSKKKLFFVVQLNLFKIVWDFLIHLKYIVYFILFDDFCEINSRFFEFFCIIIFSHLVYSSTTSLQKPL